MQRWPGCIRPRGVAGGEESLLRFLDWALEFLGRNLSPPKNIGLLRCPHSAITGQSRSNGPLVISADITRCDSEIRYRSVVVHRPRAISREDAGRVLRRSGQLSCRRRAVPLPAPANIFAYRSLHASFGGAKSRYRSATAKCPIGALGSSKRWTKCSGFAQGHAAPVVGGSSAKRCQGARCVGAAAGHSDSMGHGPLAVYQRSLLSPINRAC